MPMCTAHILITLALYHTFAIYTELSQFNKLMNIRHQQSATTPNICFHFTGLLFTELLQVRMGRQGVTLNNASR